MRSDVKIKGITQGPNSKMIALKTMVFEPTAFQALAKIPLSYISHQKKEHKIDA